MGKLWWNKLQDGDERFRDIVSSRVEGAVVRFAGGGSREWRDFVPRKLLVSKHLIQTSSGFLLLY